MQDALSYAETHFDDFVGQLEALLRIPSISTDSQYANEVERAAQWLADHLIDIGVQHAEVVATDGHPVVYAEHIVDEDRPTVLVYGHYDVQPPDPLELWTSPPFEPTRKDGTLYARGACDDKGQMFMHAKAAEAYLQQEGDLPVNLKFVIEGEEETGSKHLVPFIEAHKERLAGADIVLISDTAMFSKDAPSITYGLRGLAYTEITLTGPNRDLHSGIYGGGVENPLNALADLISQLHDENHRITIPGFYDTVRDLTEDERQTYRELPFDEEAWMQEIGLDAVRHEEGYTLLECLSGRPTLDVNGIWGGYTGEGAKTVLPAKAHAKISMRLVPDQRAEAIYDKMEAYLQELTPPTMTLQFRRLHGGKPVLVDRDHPAMQAAADAVEHVYGEAPHFVRNGGTIPVVADFKDHLGLDSVLMGFGLDSDAIHSPNEHFGLDRFHKGIEAIIRFHHTFAERVHEA
jgi:acetylornithine deacetylase/succinyl-diaminopimelate desuccinylase-like protein